ncbi:hypothetical protein BH11ARM2_BH11ARM2_16150 [soil metagenome]
MTDPRSSSPTGDISFPKLLFYHLDIPVREIVPILGKGSVNEVFRIQQENGIERILRLNHDREAEEALYEYNREVWCMKMASRAGIPTSASLGFGTWEGRSWMLQAFIPGPTAIDVPESNEAVWRFLGGCLRRMEEFDWAAHDAEARTVFGDRGPASHWQGQLGLNLDSLTPQDPLLKLGVYAFEQQEDIRRTFSELHAVQPRFGLAHGDFSRRNVILSPEGPVLIDWGCSTEGLLPIYEIGEALRNAVDGDPDTAGFRAFEEGYGSFEPYEAHIRALRLLRSFDLVRWAIEWRPDRIEELAESARKTAESYL